jgi:DNA-binding GntR family transcriptional regulator
MEKISFLQNGINHSDLTQRAYEGIRQMLYYSEIVPGQKIAYRDVAEQLKMSPTPVIQALKWLEFQGLVKHEKNRGYYMEQVSLKEIEEIYDARLLIESSLLPAVLNNIDKNSFKRLKNTYEASRKAEKESCYINKRLLKDVEFHMTLASLSDCQTQLQILKRIFDLLYLKYQATFLFISFEGNVMVDHDYIIKYISDNNLKALQETVIKHITTVKQKVLKGLSEYLKDRKKSGLL